MRGRTSGAMAIVCFAAAVALVVLRAHGVDVTFAVSPDGSRDFVSVQEAIHAVPDESLEWSVIRILRGTYFESVVVPETKQRLLLIGDDRAETVIEFDESYVNGAGQLVAVPVLTNHADDVIVRSLTIRNLADEPGGSGGKWDAAIMNFGDRLALNDVHLRGDHDTLTMYGPTHMGGPGPGRVYVTNSHIQGRGDFIASFTSAFIENTTLETIRDRGHFLFQMGLEETAPADQEALVVKNCTFTGESLDPVWPAGATNLYTDAIVYLIGNVFEFDVGANRPVVHFHEPIQASGSMVFHFDNAQMLSTVSPLVWDSYSAVGPVGTPLLEFPVTNNDYGVPIIQALSPAEAASTAPAWLFGDWDPIQDVPLLACEDGIDNDDDGRIDFPADMGCESPSSVTESPQCDDGEDNDDDDCVDWGGEGDPDPECLVPWHDDESVVYAPEPSSFLGLIVGGGFLMLLGACSRRFETLRRPASASSGCRWVRPLEGGSSRVAT